MFGVLVGTLCLIGLVKLARHGRHGWGGRGYGARRWMTRRLFERLDTTPGQEKVMQEMMDDVERKGWAAREAFLRSRADVAKALRAEPFDTAALEAAFAAQQAALDELKASVRTGVQQVHEALRPEQRAQLADLVEFGPRAFAHGCHDARGLHGHGGWHRGPAHV